METVLDGSIIKQIIVLYFSMEVTVLVHCENYDPTIDVKYREAARFHTNL